jgi:hypothetical protein
MDQDEVKEEGENSGHTSSILLSLALALPNYTLRGLCWFGGHAIYAWHITIN